MATAKQYVLAVVGSCSLAWVVAGCGHREQPEPLVPASGTARAIDMTVDDIATARCNHEQRCDQVGGDKRYSDRQHCMNTMRSETRADLNKCTTGIDEKDVRECLDEIDKEECTGAFHGLQEYKQCKLDDLCD